MEKEKMKIRRARKEDLRKISLLKRKTIKEINCPDYSKEVIDMVIEKNSLKNLTDSFNKSKMFCLFENNNLIGVIAITENKIHGLSIKYNRVGEGHGKRLMEFIEGHARNKGFKKIIVYPSKTAQNFYLKLGFKKTGKKSTWKFEDCILEENVPIMEKRIK